MTSNLNFATFNGSAVEALNDVKIAAANAVMDALALSCD